MIIEEQPFSLTQVIAEYIRAHPKIHAVNPQTGQATELMVVDYRPYYPHIQGPGNSEPKAEITIVSPNSNSPQEYFLKHVVLGPDGHGLGNAQSYVIAHSWLRDIHIPTVEELYLLVDSDHLVMMPNVRTPRSWLYGKASALYEYSQRAGDKPLDTDRVFASLDLDQVRQRAEAWALLAASHGILLPRDDPFELHINGHLWEVPVWDVSTTSKPVLRFPSIESQHRHAVSEFMQYLQEIKRLMQAYDAFRPAEDRLFQTTTNTHPTWEMC